VSHKPGGRGPTVFVPSNCNWLSFFRWALWDAYSASRDFLAKLKENKRRVGNGMGGAITAEREGTKEEK